MLNDVADIIGVERRQADDASKFISEAFKVSLFCLINLSVKCNMQSGVSSSKSASKPPKVKKPDGMSRELYSLIAREDGSTPAGEDLASLVPQPPKPAFRCECMLVLFCSKLHYRNMKAHLGRRGVRAWVWTPFNHPCRKDAFKLSHWTRADRQEESYPFAKFNKVSFYVPLLIV